MIDQRFYKSVAANTIDTDTYTVPANNSLEIQCASCNAGTSPDTIVYIIVDEGGGGETIIVSSHGDVTQKFAKPIVVAAGLTVKIKLQNDQSVADIIGGSWGGTLN